MTVDGHSYCRKCIQDWFQQAAGGKPKSPATGQPLMSLLLFPNLALGLEFAEIIHFGRIFEPLLISSSRDYVVLWYFSAFSSTSLKIQWSLTGGKALNSYKSNMQPAWLQAEKDSSRTLSVACLSNLTSFKGMLSRV